MPGQYGCDSHPCAHSFVPINMSVAILGMVRLFVAIMAPHCISSIIQSTLVMSNTA